MLCSSILCIAILALRIAHTHSFTYSFLGWNLFLAWLPLISAYGAYKLRQSLPRIFQILSTVSMGVWFIFLPNAPYLITDLAHLAPRSDMFFWFDVTMFVAFAVTGLLYGLVSLYWMQQLVFKKVGTLVSWGFAVAVLAFSSFGVYLGRFQRWNSWDVISNPMGLLTDIWQNVRHPLTHFQTYAFSGLFTLFLITAYFMLSTITHSLRDM